MLQRIGGSGWIALTDRLPTFNEDFPELATHLLDHTDISLTPFMISSDDEPGASMEQASADIEILLGVETERLTLSEARHVQSAESGLFLLTGEDASAWVDALLTSNLGNALREALYSGALIFAVDAVASALGEWVLVGDLDEPRRGLEWLPGAMILPRFRDPAESETVRSWLAGHERLYALGLAGGGIVAFGPDGEFQLWGGDSPTVALGSGW